jgi:hypothetical protein
MVAELQRDLQRATRVVYSRASAQWPWGSLKFCEKTVEDLGRRGWDDETVLRTPEVVFRTPPPLQGVRGMSIPR